MESNICSHTILLVFLVATFYRSLLPLWTKNWTNLVTSLSVFLFLSFFVYSMYCVQIVNNVYSKHGKKVSLFSLESSISFSINFIYFEYERSDAHLQLLLYAATERVCIFYTGNFAIFHCLTWKRKIPGPDPHKKKGSGSGTPWRIQLLMYFVVYR